MLEVVDIVERTALFSWDQLVRWAAIASAVLIAKAMGAALLTTRLMPVPHDNAAIATPDRN